MPHFITNTTVSGVFRGTFDQRGRPWGDCLTLPDFQRPFCWTVEDVRRLLDDVDDLRLVSDDPPCYADADHYLGSVAFLERDERPSGRLSLL